MSARTQKLKRQPSAEEIARIDADRAEFYRENNLNGVENVPPPAASAVGSGPQAIIPDDWKSFKAAELQALASNFTSANVNGKAAKVVIERELELREEFNSSASKANEDKPDDETRPIAALVREEDDMFMISKDGEDVAGPFETYDEAKAEADKL